MSFSIPAVTPVNQKKPASFGKVKLFGVDKTVLIEITAVKPHTQGLMIEGKIMGTMPMKAFLHADEMRAGLGLLKWPVIKAALGMFFRRMPKTAN